MDFTSAAEEMVLRGIAHLRHARPDTLQFSNPPTRGLVPSNTATIKLLEVAKNEENISGFAEQNLMGRLIYDIQKVLGYKSVTPPERNGTLIIFGKTPLVAATT